MAARTDWLVCRLAPGAPGGVEYLVNISLAPPNWFSGPLVSANQAEAWTGHRQSADAVADVLNLHGGGSEDRGAWTALPAVIRVPAPYQPQDKGADERRRAASPEDVAALRAAVFGAASKGWHQYLPTPTVEVEFALALISFAIRRDISLPVVREVLAQLDADNAETAKMLRMSCLRR